METQNVKSSEMKIKKLSSENKLSALNSAIKKLYGIKVNNGNLSFEGTFMMYIKSKNIKSIENRKNTISIETEKFSLTLFKDFEKSIIVIYE